MWCTVTGQHVTSQRVCDELLRQCGASYTVSELHAAYCVGAVYKNGGIWFQRIK